LVIKYFNRTTYNNFINFPLSKSKFLYLIYILIIFLDKRNWWLFRFCDVDFWILEFKDFGLAGPLGINNVVFSQTVGVLRYQADALTRTNIKGSLINNLRIYFFNINRTNLFTLLIFLLMQIIIIIKKTPLYMVFLTFYFLKK